MGSLDLEDEVLVQVVEEHDGAREAEGGVEVQHLHRLRTEDYASIASFFTHRVSRTSLASVVIFSLALLDVDR